MQPTRTQCLEGRSDAPGSLRQASGHTGSEPGSEGSLQAHRERTPLKQARVAELTAGALRGPSPASPQCLTPVYSVSTSLTPSPFSPISPGKSLFPEQQACRSLPHPHVCVQWCVLPSTPSPRRFCAAPDSYTGQQKPPHALGPLKSWLLVMLQGTSLHSLAIPERGPLARGGSPWLAHPRARQCAPQLLAL